MRIKELRLKNHLTQIELAEIIDTSHKNISKYENLLREPDINTLIKIADYFNVSLDYLVDRPFDFIENPLSHNKQGITNIKYSADSLHLINLYQQLNEKHQIALTERAETLLEMQEDSIIQKNNATTPQKGA